ncbi:MAG: radical SAM protein [Candidatus Omnitrophica bacterium]|nr:radical SAM protein [Candidatus Omnitrophota bacterium]MDD5591914.1 radical SAM protein [Candidatus Omnitrophota bacterium]
MPHYSRMKISLVTPPFDLIRSAYASSSKIKRGNLPPLGIGYLASSLKANGFNQIKLLDGTSMGINEEEFIELVLKDSPDLIGISCMTASSHEAFRLARKIRKLSNVLIVFGGPHVTDFGKEVLLEEKAIDLAVVGEGEETIVELCDRLNAGKELSNIKGLIFRDKDEIIDNGPRVSKGPLDDIPMPAWELYDNTLYCPLPNSYKRLPSATVITARGCAYRKCAFCYTGGMLGQPFRRHSIKRVIEEIKILVNSYGMREIQFLDSIFILNRQWVKEFCEAIIRENIDITWNCGAKADLVDPEILEIVAKAGCYSIFYGLESGNQDLLDIIEKGITIQQIKDAVKWAHRAGIDTRGSFILGLPGETPQKANKTIDLAIELDLTYAQFNLAFPFKGTKLYDFALDMGSVFEYRGLTKATYVPHGYRDRDELEAVMRKAYFKFYFRPAYFMKHLKRLKNFNELKRYFDGLRFIIGIIFNKAMGRK